MKKLYMGLMAALIFGIVSLSEASFLEVADKIFCCGHYGLKRQLQLAREYNKNERKNTRIAKEEVRELTEQYALLERAYYINRPDQSPDSPENLHLHHEPNNNIDSWDSFKNQLNTADNESDTESDSDQEVQENGAKPCKYNDLKRRYKNIVIMSDQELEQRIKKLKQD